MWEAAESVNHEQAEFDTVCTLATGHPNVQSITQGPVLNVDVPSYPDPTWPDDQQNLKSSAQKAGLAGLEALHQHHLTRIGIFHCSMIASFHRSG